MVEEARVRGYVGKVIVKAARLSAKHEMLTLLEEATL